MELRKLRRINRIIADSHRRDKTLDKSCARHELRVVFMNRINLFAFLLLLTACSKSAKNVTTEGTDSERQVTVAETDSDLTVSVDSVTFKMIRVEGGTFQMGSMDGANNEKPVHEVTLSSFSIGETEVTQELWEVVMGDNPSFFKGSKRPVEEVSWDDCQTFIARLNELTGKMFRLPTEAEWEFAARGGNQSKGYTYSGSNTIRDVAWFGDTSESGTHNVAMNFPNELGIYDMSGNVYEWCQDWYGSYGSRSQTNPTGPSSGSERVERGGCWDFIEECCRVASRDSRYSPTLAYRNLGFRLAL